MLLLKGGRILRHRQTPFRQLPIQIQFMSISGLFLCTVIISALLLIHSTQKILINNATNYVDMASDKFTNELDVLCLQLDVIASHIQSDSLYQELLSTPDYHSLAPYTISEISQNVSYLKSLYPDIVDIAFANDLVHWSALFSESDLHTLYEEALMDGYPKNHSLGLKKSSFLPLADETYYVYCSHIYSNGRSIGCAFISLDINQLNMEGFSQDSPASYFLMDTVGNLYPISAGSEYSDTILASCQDALQEAAKESSDAEHSLILNRHFSIQMDYSDTAQCYIISAVYIPAISKMLHGMKEQMFLIILLIIVFFMTLLIILYRNLITPLNSFNHMIREMDKQKTRHLAKPLDIDGCAEVRDLSLAFFEMFSAIDTLNVQIFETSSKLYEEKIRGQATEISYFRSQINPHFLYNVLSLIRSQALAHDVPEIAAIAIAMGKMYRYNTKGAPIVPFQEELEMTRAYVEIQKFRFQDKFDIIYNIPEEALTIPVIKIILQPLVENAIQHGIEPSLEKCMLYIGATLTNEEFIIEIRNDGVGMSPERLAHMQKLLQTRSYDATNYVGITNTNARLKLQYGDAYGITIDSQENDGTVVAIHMPLPHPQAD